MILPTNNCWLSSDDAFLLYQTQKQITGKMGKNQSIINITISNADDWQQLESKINIQDLFYTKKIIFCHLPVINAKIADKLTTIFKSINSQNTIYIISKKISNAQKKTKWYIALSNVIKHIPIWPLDDKSYSKWLLQQIKFYKLTIDKSGINAIDLIAQKDPRVSVNILEKLSINFQSDKTIIADDITNNCSDVCTASVFELTNLIFAGDIRAAIQKISNVEQTPSNIIIIWSILHKSISLAYQASFWPLSEINKLCKNYLEQERLKTILKRHTTKSLRQILINLWMLENTIKGLNTYLNPWQELIQTIQMIGKNND